MSILLETASCEGSNRWRHIGRQGVPVRFTLEDARQDVGGIVALERPCAGQHLEEDAAEGPDVAAFVCGTPFRLLGAHVGGRAENHAGLGGREPEIEDFDLIVRRQRDVRWLQIAVDDAFVMRGLERVGNLSRDGERVIKGQRPMIAQPIGECVAVDELQHEGLDWRV